MKRCDPCPNPHDICSCALYRPNRITRKSIHQIKYDVAQKEGFTVQELASKSRRQEIVRARSIAMRICRKEGYTLTEIGNSFNRNHTTVSYALTKGESNGDS